MNHKEDINSKKSRHIKILIDGNSDLIIMKDLNISWNNKKQDNKCSVSDRQKILTKDVTGKKP